MKGLAGVISADNQQKSVLIATDQQIYYLTANNVSTGEKVISDKLLAVLTRKHKILQAVGSIAPFCASVVLTKEQAMNLVVEY